MYTAQQMHLEVHLLHAVPRVSRVRGCACPHDQLSHAWSDAVVRSVATGGRAPGVGRSEAAAARFMKMSRHPNSRLRICDGAKVVLKAFVFD